MGMLFIMKTLEDEGYIVTKACKFTVFGIMRDFLHYHILVSALIFHIEYAFGLYSAFVWLNLFLGSFELQSKLFIPRNLYREASFLVLH